jgi:hypothetical protein
VFAALLMIYESGPTLRDRFAFARQTLLRMRPLRGRRPGVTYQGYVKAQKRWFLSCPERLAAIQEHLRTQVRRVAGGVWMMHGWVCFGVDGSRVELPRTKANQTAFGCAGRRKTAPQLALTTVFHLGTGLPWDWTIGAGTEAERGHLRRMLAHLPAGSLIVADAGFVGYELLQTLRKAEHNFLIRVGSNVTLLTDLGLTPEPRERVWLWPGNQRRHPPLKLRLIRLAQSDGSAMCLLTNVFDETRLSQAVASDLYRQRWGAELFYRGLKQTLEQRKLRSASPELAKLELFWGVMALTLLGLMTVEGLTPIGAGPRQASLAEGLRIVRHATRTSARWRRRGDLRVLLQTAVRDRYPRRSSKKARDWPHKKRDKRAGTPPLRVATPCERRAAKKWEYAA